MRMEGEMRATLLSLTVAIALFPSRLFAQEFNCFDTPEGGQRCACMGVAACGEMRQSGNCKSDPLCDQGQLGVVVCSCDAGRASRKRH